MVLLLCDVAVGPQRPLTYLVGRLTPVLEGLLVIILVAGVEMGSLLKPSTAIGGVVNPASLGIVIVWVVGLYVINRAAKDPRWSIEMPGSQPGRRHRERAHPDAAASVRRLARRRGSRAIFGAACTVTLGAGVDARGERQRCSPNRLGVNGVIFGATVLATATALPEICSGIAAVRLGDNALAMGDIFGGNAFQVCLFLVADLVAGKPVLQSAGNLNAWLAALGVALTGGLRLRRDRPAAPLPFPARPGLDPRARGLFSFGLGSRAHERKDRVPLASSPRRQRARGAPAGGARPSPPVRAAARDAARAPPFPAYVADAKVRRGRGQTPDLGRRENEALVRRERKPTTSVSSAPERGAWTPSGESGRRATPRSTARGESRRLERPTTDDPPPKKLAHQSRYFGRSRSGSTRRRSYDRPVETTERHLRLLTETIAAVNSTLDLEEVLHLVANEVAAALEADACFVYLYDDAPASSCCARRTARGWTR